MTEQERAEKIARMRANRANNPRHPANVLAQHVTGAIESGKATAVAEHKKAATAYLESVETKPSTDIIA